MKVLRAFLIVIGTLAASIAIEAAGQSRRLQLPVVQQEHSQWCWSADASAVLKYRGVKASQCALANWVDSVTYACGSYPFYWNDTANEPNYLAGTTGIGGILWSWARRTSRYFAAPLTYAATRSSIDAGNPVVILWSWAGGGGHFIVIDGYDDHASMLYFMNPWPGEGAGYGDYGWVRSGTGDMGTHSWAESLVAY
jgi:hypothetical protein